MCAGAVPYLHLFSRNQSGHLDAAFKFKRWLTTALFRVDIQLLAGSSFELLRLRVWLFIFPFEKGKRKEANARYEFNKILVWEDVVVD